MITSGRITADAAAVTDLYLIPDGRAQPHNRQQIGVIMDKKDAVTVLLDAGSKLALFWNFYVIGFVALLGFGFSKAFTFTDELCILLAIAFILFSIFNYIGLIQLIQMLHAMLDEVKLCIVQLDIKSSRLYKLLNRGVLPYEMPATIITHLIADAIMLWLIFTVF